MEHGTLQQWSRWPLEAGAATLEVTIDPAAHGPTALGPVSRGVMLMTGSGEELRFTLKAVVTP